MPDKKKPKQQQPKQQPKQSANPFKGLSTQELEGTMGTLADSVVGLRELAGSRPRSDDMTDSELVGAAQPVTDASAARVRLNKAIEERARRAKAEGESDEDIESLKVAYLDDTLTRARTAFDESRRQALEPRVEEQLPAAFPES
mgnify:CR=1 FL=1